MSRIIQLDQKPKVNYRLQSLKPSHLGIFPTADLLRANSDIPGSQPYFRFDKTPHSASNLQSHVQMGSLCDKEAVTTLRERERGCESIHSPDNLKYAINQQPSVINFFEVYIFTSFFDNTL